MFRYSLNTFGPLNCFGTIFNILSIILNPVILQNVFLEARLSKEDPLEIVPGRERARKIRETPQGLKIYFSIKSSKEGFDGQERGLSEHLKILKRKIIIL